MTPNMSYQLTIVIAAGLLLSACTSAAIRATPSQRSSPHPKPAETAAPVSTPTPQLSTTKAVTPPTSSVTLLPAEPPPSGAQSQFTTDFSKHSVLYNEILSGGPPKDGIPAIDHPKFISIGEADTWLKPVEPVVLVQVGDDARAYPLQVLTWHEIVNDTVGGTPLVVTFCPLCNTAIAFERAVDGRILDFGTTGRLRFSNLIMYDRPTETWWQQATGNAIAGALIGTQLAFHPASIISWADFKASNPNGKVLSRDTGFSRPYGRNPYIGYDDVNRPPFLYLGPETPGKLPPVARVLTVDLDGAAVAYPYDVLKDVRVVNDTLGGKDIVVFWQAGTASALDSSSIADGRDVGAASAFLRELDGRTLTFKFDGSRILDDETGSEWNVLGTAVNGPLAGKSLTPIVAVNHFWFSWAAFKPDTRVYQP